MSTSISDSAGKMIFQSDMMADIRRINKTEYAVFEGKHDNGTVSVDFDIRVKTGYIKKTPIDLIKNDHIIFQKRGQIFFFLFEADKKKFDREEESIYVFTETGKTSNYNYRIRFTRNTAAGAVKKHTSKLGGEAGKKMDAINELLEKNGITEVDAASPVDAYMKTWKLGHPDEE